MQKSSLKSKKFSLFRNLNHSINGIIEVSKNEKPMQIELVAFVIMSIVILFLDMGLVYKLVLFTSLFIPIFAELINSAVERVVDLVTFEYHELAKHAKDAASAVVLIGIIITTLIWVVVFVKVYNF